MFVKHPWHYGLECGHDVSCGCEHALGDYVYCYRCDDWTKVVGKAQETMSL